MAEETIITSSPIGRHLDRLSETKQVSYILVNKKKIQLVAKITIGREYDNTIVLDSKLTSRHHCLIQKIKDAYFVKDLSSTNGTFINGSRIPPDKYVKLNPGDKLTVGGQSLVLS